MADSQDVQDKIVQLMKAIRARLAESPPGSETTALKASQEHLQEALDELSMDSLSQAATDVAKATNDLQQMVDSAPGQTLPDALQKALDAIGGLGKSTVQPSPPDPKTTTVQRLAPGPQSDTASADPTAKTKVPSAFVSQVVQVATDQWTFFGEQEYEANGNVRTVGHKEGEDPWFKTIGQYWLKGTNTHGLDGQDHASPWSAAFISWVMKEAGAGDRFRYSTQHSVYISQAIRDFSSKRSGAGFWGQRLNEYQPAVGDLVCWSRQDGVDYDHQLGGDYKGHSDIIVAVESARIWIIGGNVGDSVTKRPLPLDARGFLGPISQGGETVFAIMQDRIGSPESDSSDVGPAVAGTKVSQASANEGPDATLQGFDADFDCSQHLSKAKAAGINFIGRYYSNSPGKNLSPSEARLITGAGMFIVAVWETLGNHASFFSHERGADDAKRASTQAQAVGQPIDSAIYFAVDYDASPQEIAGGITDYFKGVQQGLAAAMPGKLTYSVGVYGSGLTCDTLFKAGLVQHTWLAMSSGFRGSKTYTSWNIKQSLDTDLLGLGQSHKVDPDVSHNAANGGLGAFTVALGGIPRNF